MFELQFERESKILTDFLDGSEEGTLRKGL